MANFMPYSTVIKFIDDQAISENDSEAMENSLKTQDWSDRRIKSG